MAKNLQLYTLFNMMKAAGSKGVTKEQVSKELGIAEKSVAVYVFSLKKYFKAEYEAVKQGRQVVAYKLVNSGKDVSVRQFRKGSKANNKPVATKPVKVAKIKSSNFDVPTLEQDNDVPHISDHEFNDIKTSLGIM